MQVQILNKLNLEVISDPLGQLHRKDLISFEIFDLKGWRPFDNI